MATEPAPCPGTVHVRFVDQSPVEVVYRHLHGACVGRRCYGTTERIDPHQWLAMPVRPPLPPASDPAPRPAARPARKGR